MKMYKGVVVQIHVFLTSALVGDEWSASRPCSFTPREIGPDPGLSERDGCVKILDTIWTQIPISQSSSSKPVAIPTALPQFVFGLVRRDNQRGDACTGLTESEVIVKEHCLLGYNTVYSIENQPTLRRNMQPTSPESPILCCILLNWFDHEDAGNIFLRNIGWFSTDYTEFYARRMWSLYPALWEPNIPQDFLCFILKPFR
jgi:hypothetical protein